MKLLGKLFAPWLAFVSIQSRRGNSALFSALSFLHSDTDWQSILVGWAGEIKSADPTDPAEVEVGVVDPDVRLRLENEFAKTSPSSEENPGAGDCPKKPNLAYRREWIYPTAGQSHRFTPLLSSHNWSETASHQFNNVIAMIY